MVISSENSKGGLVISEEVVASIAINAAKDVDGISSFSNRPVDVVSTLRKGSLKVTSPVRITEDTDGLAVSIYVNILPGKEIQPVAVKVQSAVKDAIQNMTGKNVAKVNVVIAGIDFTESKDKDEPKETEE